jgi:SAM-dependent methyltransferase
MEGRRPTRVPVATDRDPLRRLPEMLQSAGYTVERIEAELGTHELSGRAVDRSVQRRRLAGGGPFAALARLFLVEDALAVAELESALAPGGVALLADSGLCDVDGTLARATAKLLPHGDYYIASDLGQAAGTEIPFDHVPGVQAPSVTLAKLAVRLDVDAALDLGTGSGLQALLAAKHCRRVVATDINQRALAFAAFNAELNGVRNIEFRHGWGFEPVAGEQFDLIVSNPPYVISPDHTYAYRDSEIRGDELCRRIVTEAGTYLRADGFAHVLVSWTYPAGGDWATPLRDWVAGHGCDAWLLHYRTNDPLTHASGWLRPLGEQDPGAFDAALDRWLAYCAQRGIDAVGFGAIVLRRRTGMRNWVRAETLPLDSLAAASAHTLRAFAGNDLLGDLAGDHALLQRRFRLTEHHRLRQSLTCADGRCEVAATTLELTDGLAFSVTLDRYTTLLLPQLDGTRSLRQVLENVAAGLDLPDAARSQFVPAALPAVRRLLQLGFLVPC